MKSNLTLLDDSLVERVVGEAFELMQNPGIKVQSKEARLLLNSSGAEVDEASEIVKIPEKLALASLSSVPRSFYLHDYSGKPVVHYGGDSIQFDPGSSGTNVLDPYTLDHKEAVTDDLVKIIKVAEGLSAYDAQSTSVVCSEVPKEIQDIYRLYLVLLYSIKPIVTGAFSAKGINKMIDMLAIMSGGHENLRQYPRAVFDVCPSPPLIWSGFGAGCLIALARAGVPAEMVSMPIAGAAAPVTLIGSVTQHAAECLSGIVIHQLANSGSPIVWGGAPAVMDMRKGSTPMGAIETAMIDCATAQVGKYFSMPTHTYLGGSDSKLVDAQAGLENGMAILIGALSGVNMISGSGMIESLLCMSPEKLVIDAESISMARRLVRGIETPTETLATGFYAGINFKGGDFLKQKITKHLFKQEQYLTGPVIDRGSTRDWNNSGRLDAFGRATLEVQKILASYQRPVMDQDRENKLRLMMCSLAKSAGMENLPPLE